MKTKPRKKRKQKAQNEPGYWSARMGLCEFTTEDQQEVQRRTAEVLAARLKEPLHNYSSVPLTRHGTSVYRAMNHGARRGGFGIGHGDY